MQAIVRWPFTNLTGRVEASFLNRPAEGNGMQDVIVHLVSVAAASVLFYPRVTRFKIWRATITPLASIIASDCQADPESRTNAKPAQEVCLRRTEAQALPASGQQNPRGSGSDKIAVDRSIGDAYDSNSERLSQCAGGYPAGKPSSRLRHFLGPNSSRSDAPRMSRSAVCAFRRRFPCLSGSIPRLVVSR